MWVSQSKYILGLLASDITSWKPVRKMRTGTILLKTLIFNGKLLNFGARPVMTWPLTSKKSHGECDPRFALRASCIMAGPGQRPKFR